jgi:homoserine dehydrogenase
MKEANVGLIGFGTVGTGVVKILGERAGELKDRTGVDLRLAGVYDSDPERLKGAEAAGAKAAGSADEVIDEADVVIELIGGTDAAFEITRKVLEAGKPVVNANKALIATRGSELFSIARKNNTCMAFEASVCGGVPVIAALRDGLASNRISSVLGIVNGTSNYVLTKMTRESWTYEHALGDAQKRGYAEADPTLDVEGIDSAHKIAILSRIAFGVAFDFDTVYTEGITRITPQDIHYAEEFGYVVKLLAVARHDGALDVRVHPALLPRDHPLAFVDAALNAVCITGDVAGTVMLHGKGAGQMPTAGAVVSDLVDVLLGRASATFAHMKAFSDRVDAGAPVGMEDVETRYYARFMVDDQPGVLSMISGILGKNNISIASVIQMERDVVKAVPVVMMTHHARERDMRAAVKEIDRNDVVRESCFYMRVEQ